MEKKKLYRRCDFCNEVGVANVDVFWEIDSYAQDIEGVIIRHWYHKECLEYLALEI